MDVEVRCLVQTFAVIWWSDTLMKEEKQDGVGNVSCAIRAVFVFGIERL